MFFYTLIFILILCLVPLDFVIVTRFYRSCLLSLFAITLTFFCAFRAVGVDKDSYNYLSMFNIFYNYFDSLSFGVEPGFSFVTTLLKKINLDSINYLFLVFALISVPVKIKFIYKYSKYPILSILIFYSFMYFKQDFTQIRAAVAVAIYVWAIDDILYKRFKLFFLKIVLASFFHVSAIILCLTYFISNKEINKRNYFLMLFGSFAAANIKLTTLFLKLPFFSFLTRLQSYIEKSASGATDVFNTFGLLFLMQFVISFLLLYFIDIIKDKDKHSVFFVKLLLCGTISLYLLGGLSVAIATRINELLVFSICISYTYFIYFIKPKLYAILFVVFLCGALYWFQMYYSHIVTDYVSWV
ncbi:MAG: EpsG family protein [Burkholderiales bacterium]|nr:EpsG family protein [Burkholderiales bacterium]